MSKSPKTRKRALKTTAVEGGPARKPAKMGRCIATSGKVTVKSGRSTVRSLGNAKPAARNGTKQAMLMDLLGSSKGASVPEIAAKAGWQQHSVRGFLSGTVKKKLGLTLTSEALAGRGRVYRIAKRP